MRNLKASIVIFLFDIMSLILAFVVSGMLAAAISSEISGTPDILTFSDTFTNRIYIFTIMACALLFSFYNRGHYSRRIPWWNQVRFIFITVIMLLFIDGFIHFAMKYQFSRIWLVLSWVVSFLFILIGRFLSRVVCEKMQAWKVPTIVIGSGENAIDTMFAIHSDNYTGYDVKTLILHHGYEDFNRDDLPIGYKNVNIIDGAADYSDYINKHAGNFYIIAPDSLADIDVENLVVALSNVDASYAIVPPVKGLALYGNTPQYFFGHDVMLMQARPKINSPLGKIIKRTMDIVGSIILLITLSPLFLVVSIFVKKDGGSVFFLNKRLGFGGKKFYCLKFRTMIPDAERVLQEVLDKDPEAKEMWKTHRKMKFDPRITKTGSFLRKSSIDELPQLINILKGEMSMVGPRPILPDEAVFFDNNQMKSYYSVRPGMTGLWQVSGRNNTTFKQRVHLDTWYVKNWSIWYDIVILFKTITVVAKRGGVY